MKKIAWDIFIVVCDLLLFVMKSVMLEITGIVFSRKLMCVSNSNIIFLCLLLFTQNLLLLQNGRRSTGKNS